MPEDKNVENRRSKRIIKLEKDSKERIKLRKRKLRTIADQAKMGSKTKHQEKVFIIDE